MFEILCTAAFVAVAFGGMAVCAWLDGREARRTAAGSE